MQCNAMPCHAALLTHFQPILEQAAKVGTEPRKKEQERNKSSILLCSGLERRRTPPSSSPPSIRTPTDPTVTSYQREKKKNRKAQTTKSCASFQKASQSFRSLVAKTINTSVLDNHVMPRGHGWNG